MDALSILLAIGCVSMPRSKPSDCVEHRITLGTKERELLDSALVAYQFNKVSTPIVAGLSDVSFMIVLGGLLSAIFPDIVIPAGVNTVEDIADAISAGLKSARERNPDNTFDISDRGFWEYLFEEGTIVGRIFT